MDELKKKLKATLAEYAASQPKKHDGDCCPELAACLCAAQCAAIESLCAIHCACHMAGCHPE